MNQSRSQNLVAGLYSLQTLQRLATLAAAYFGTSCSSLRFHVFAQLQSCLLLVFALKECADVISRVQTYYKQILACQFNCMYYF